MPTIRRHVSPYFRVRAVQPQALSAGDLSAWAALESRAVEPNAYASPHFVMPALRYLDPLAQATVFLVERVSAADRELIGAAVFQRAGASRLFPMAHLVSYRSRHSYLGGMLLDRAWTREALTALLDHVDREPGHNGIEIPQMWADGELADILRKEPGERAGLHRDPGADTRAVLDPREAGEALLQRTLGKQRLKDHARRSRRLAEQGELGWRFHREQGVPDSAVERFLALEHAGWKGEAGSSLRSNPSDEAFFRDTVARFGAEGRALFCELTLDGQAIASTVNFISGRVAFGFKIGWDPAFKAFSPGILNELEFVRQAPTAFADLAYFDSGSTADSYIDGVWPARRSIATATIATDPMARLVTGTATSARHLKRRLKTSRVHTAAMHALKPEWMSLAHESLATFGILF